MPRLKCFVVTGGTNHVSLPGTRAARKLEFVIVNVADISDMQYAIYMVYVYVYGICNIYSTCTCTSMHNPEIALTAATA